MNKDIQKLIDDSKDKKYSKLSDKKLAANDLIAQRNKQPDFIKKVVEGRKGFVFPEHAKKLISDKNKGRKHTKESSIKKSLATKGIKKSKEHCNNISKGLKGKEKTESHKKNLSLSKLGTKNNFLSESNSMLNTQKFLCEYCNREIGGFANYKRFHADNCKLKKINL